MSIAINTPLRFETERPALTGDAEVDRGVIDDHAFSEIVEIADTGTAGTVNTVRHGLRRKPRGVRIARCVVAAGTGAVSPVPYQEADDEDWTTTELNTRFSESNLRVALEVF